MTDKKSASPYLRLKRALRRPNLEAKHELTAEGGRRWGKNLYQPRRSLRGLRLIHDNGDATKKIMTQWLNLSPQVAADSYQLIIASFSLDGEADEMTLKSVIEARRKSSKVEKEISLEQIVDFRSIREVRRELGL